MQGQPNTAGAVGPSVDRVVPSELHQRGRLRGHCEKRLSAGVFIGLKLNHHGVALLH